MITLGVIGPFQIVIILVLLLIPLALVILLVKISQKNKANTVACPYCGERIMNTAKKCRYCGEWLTDKPAK